MTKQKKADPEILWPCGITDAARYCGMSVSALKYHIYTAGDLQGRPIGHSLVFERAQLDQFMAEKRRPGRPAFAPDPSLVSRKSIAPLILSEMRDEAIEEESIYDTW